MQHPVLKIAVGRAYRTLKPRRHENAERRHAVGINVQKPEDARLGIAQRVQHRAGFERTILGQVHHELHADRPVTSAMPRRHPEMFVDLPTNRTHRSITNHRQRGANIHPRREAVRRVAFLVRPLIDEPHTDNAAAIDQWLGDRCTRPNLNRTCIHQLCAHPLIELPQGQQQPAVLAQVRRDVGQLQGRTFDRQQSLERANHSVRCLQCHRATARADWIKQVQNLFVLHGGAHRNLRRVEVRERLANPAGPGHHARHAKPNVIRPLVTDHLRGRTGQDGAFHFRRSVAVQQPAG